MIEREPERWLTDRAADPELRRLLAAGRNELPPPHALRVAPLVISTLLTVQAAAAAAPVAQGAARHALTTAVLKWFAGGVLVGAAALSVPQVLKPVQPVAPVVIEGALPQVRARVRAEPAQPSVAVPAVVDAAPSAAPVKASAVRADVAREVALLDAARVALVQGDARRALDALTVLDRLPARSLVPEATLLRVRALLALNELTTARKVAARFVATAPNAPQVPVLRALFAEPLETKMIDSASRESKAAIQSEASEL